LIELEQNLVLIEDGGFLQLIAHLLAGKREPTRRPQKVATQETAYLGKVLAF